MTLTELRYIVAVAQERHFGRAAQRCFVSQPTLSIAIKKLEEELGCTLFDRSSNEVMTTEMGGRIVAQARKVLEEADIIKTLADTKQDELSGVFKLGLIFTIAPYLLPKLILALRHLAPNMPLQLEENYTETLIDLLKNGEIDAAILAEPIQESGIITTPLYDESFFVIVPKKHQFEQLDAITPDQFAEEKVLLLTEGNCLRENILSSCRELAARQKIPGLANTIQGSSINTIRHMVASGLGISILPATALTENDHLLFSIIPFTAPSPKRRIVLASRRHFVRQRALDTLHTAVLNSKLIGVEFIQS